MSSLPSQFLSSFSSRSIVQSSSLLVHLSLFPVPLLRVSAGLSVLASSFLALLPHALTYFHDLYVALSLDDNDDFPTCPHAQGLDALIIARRSPFWPRRRPSSMPPRVGLSYRSPSPYPFSLSTTVDMLFSSLVAVAASISFLPIAQAANSCAVLCVVPCLFGLSSLRSSLPFPCRYRGADLLSKRVLCRV
jgi:hypothetical protein